MLGLIMGLVGNLIRVRPEVSVPQGEQQATDPVCGMSIQRERAAKAEYNEEMYYFCCSHCQQAFQNSPSTSPPL
jgi:YHS domain-containing protein